jgi:membrane-bound lytic murein transglycosylase B
MSTAASAKADAGRAASVESPAAEPDQDDRRALWPGAFLIVLAGVLVAAVGLSRAQVMDVPQASVPVVASAVPTATVVAPVVSGYGRNLTKVDADWVTQVATRTGIPRRALLAYAAADLASEAKHSGCGLSWNTLAGIGAIESAHGTHGGAVLGADGRSRPVIRGPVLNGEGVGSVPDTDQGRVDGDSHWDRAVGPLQFLPSTWQRWGVDGSDDGIADPDSLDDAALAAADYLCAAGGDLTSAKGWTAAVFAYNHAQTYVDAVRKAANRYGEAAR